MGEPAYRFLGRDWRHRHDVFVGKEREARERIPARTRTSYGRILVRTSIVRSVLSRAIVPLGSVPLYQYLHTEEHHKGVDRGKFLQGWHVSSWIGLTK